MHSGRELSLSRREPTIQSPNKMAAAQCTHSIDNASHNMTYILREEVWESRCSKTIYNTYPAQFHS